MMNSALRGHLRTSLVALALLIGSGAALAETVLLTRGDNDFGLGWLFLDSKGQCRIAVGQLPTQLRSFEH